MFGKKEERLRWIDERFPRWEAHTLWTMFERSCQQSPDVPFIITETETFSYREAETEICRTAKCLMALGVGRRSHVALMLHNCPEYLFLTFALARLGAIKVAVNPNIGREELEYVLRQANVEYLFCHEILDDVFLKETSGLRKAVFWRKSCLYRSRLAAFRREFDEGGAPISDEALRDATVGGRCADDVFDIVFTSGSTSAPKGVMLTHDMLLRTAYGSCVSRLFECGRRICVPVPLYHNLGYVEGVLAAMLVSGAVIIATEKVTSKVLFRLLHSYRANDLLTVPTQIIDFLAHETIAPEDVSSLHAVYSSAGTCPDWVWGEIRKRLFVTDVITAFGMTEVTASTMQTRPDDPDDFVVKYVGTLKPGGVAGLPEYGGFQSAYKVVDLNTGRDLPRGQAGELCCRGKTVMRGYYGHPEINAAVFDADGWFHTNDIGVLHENGYLSFIGRNNDSYKINGELVSPQFLDRVISRCDSVNEVETVGIKHPKYGAVGVAFIDADDVGEETKRKIYRYCQQHLAPFQVPRFFVFEPEAGWPKTAVGKIQKFRLCEAAQEKIRRGEVWTGEP